MVRHPGVIYLIEPVNWQSKSHDPVAFVDSNINVYVNVIISSFALFISVEMLPLSPRTLVYLPTASFGTDFAIGRA